MTLRLLTSSLVALCVVATGSIAWGQEPQQSDDLPAPPHLSLIEGSADLEREGRVGAAELGQILAAGDRLSTRAGRIEILFGDGSALHLDEGTTVDLLDDGLVRLLAGRVFLHVTTSDDSAFEYRVDTPAATISTDVPGEYRLLVPDPDSPTTELAVARGAALVTTEQDSLTVRAGELVRVRAGERPGYPVAFNAADWSAFDRWSYERRHGRVQPYASALPVALSPYATTLGHHGTWSHHATYGAVWYPRVAVGWRPFFHGRWTSFAPYGWTWIGFDAWSWPTHYYGSWGVTHAGVWFWVPGRHWRPAAVHWTITAGHIGWVPWGFGRIDRFGFTVVPRRAFAVNVVVPRHAVRVHTIRPVVRSAVVVRPPLPRGSRAPRAFAADRRLTANRTVFPARDGIRSRDGSSAQLGSRRAVPRDQVGGTVTTQRAPGGRVAPRERVRAESGVRSDGATTQSSSSAPAVPRNGMRDRAMSSAGTAGRVSSTTGKNPRRSSASAESERSVGSRVEPSVPGANQPGGSRDDSRVFGRRNPSRSAIDSGPPRAVPGGNSGDIAVRERRSAGPRASAPASANGFPSRRSAPEFSRRSQQGGSVTAAPPEMRRGGGGDRPDRGSGGAGAASRGGGRAPAGAAPRSSDSGTRGQGRAVRR